MKVNSIPNLILGICSLQLASFSLHAQVPVPFPEAAPPIPAPVIPKTAEAQSVPKTAQEASQTSHTQNLHGAPALPERAMEILDFWFGPLPDPSFFPEDKMEMWLDNSPETDRKLAANYAQDVINARKGLYNSWRQTPRGRLALIILLDLIPRHIFRGTPFAYSSDAMAKALALEGIQKREDRALFPIERALLYVPLEHSEDLATQNIAVASYQRLLVDSPYEIKPVMQDFLDFAIMHQQQIAHFGRFPARNAIFGRVPTQEELLFLNQRGQRGKPPF